MKREEINIRDPFVLVHEGKYYLYGTRGPECWGEGTGLDVYVGTDLEEFVGPFVCFTPPAGFGADRNFWAPEVYAYEGRFYMFVSFKAEGKCRGTQILRSDSPLGPFLPHSDGPVTPRDWECLDGTLYLEAADGNRPYMIFAHEWVQVRDGEVCAVELSPDLKKAVGVPKLLFRASEAPWVKTIRDGAYVTDGPFVYRNEEGRIAMLWSSFGAEGYTLALARSESNTVEGPWIQDPEPLFTQNGGHGMLFKTLDGKLNVSLHYPNVNLEEKPVFFEIKRSI